MQELSDKKLKLFPIFLVVTVVFGIGVFAFKNLFTGEIIIKEDLSEKRYYTSLLRSENLESRWEPGEIAESGVGVSGVGVNGVGVNGVGVNGVGVGGVGVGENLEGGGELGEGGDGREDEGQLEISAESGILVDINSGRIVFEKKSTKKMKIASLVKIMTAVVALEHKNMDDRIVVSEEAAGVGENTMGISEGEVYTLEELLYGLMLNSGNDSAYAIAEGVAGSEEDFVNWMNIKAKELNLNDTEFFDPSGLDDNTYSTAVDLVKLSRYAMQNEDFRRIVGTVDIELPYSEKHKYLYLENQTNLLTTYPGVGGIKTGYTEEAGYCLVTYAKNEGVELIGVVLNSVNRKFDMLNLLNFGFGVYGIEVESEYE